MATGLKDKAEVDQNFELEIFVSGLTLKSIQTINVLREVCETHLFGSYNLRIIDIYQEPKLAKANEIIAVPTVIKRSPGPKQVFIGDLSQPDSLYQALGFSFKEPHRD